MIAKLEAMEEEADETLYRLELLGEADEILAMTVASVKTLRRRQARGKESR